MEDVVPDAARPTAGAGMSRSSKTLVSTTRELLRVKTAELRFWRSRVRRADAERRDLLLRLANETLANPEEQNVRVLVPPPRRCHLKIRRVNRIADGPKLRFVKTTAAEGETS